MSLLCLLQLAQVVYAYLPRAYAAPRVTSGLEMVQSLQWMYSTTALDGWANSSMFVRTAQLPAIQTSLVAALQSVTGDAGTLLKPPITWELSPSIRIAGITLASLGLLLTVAAAVVVIRHRQHAVFRSASPLLILASFVGLLHVFAAIVFLVLPPTSFSCSALNWCIQLGFTLLFTPILAKAWRIWRIFGRRKLHVVKVTNSRLLTAILAATVCDLILLAAWYATSLPGVVLTTQSASTGGTLNLLQETDYGSCSYSGRSASFFAAECIIKGAALLSGVLLAFSTRRVTGRFNESKSVALVIYNTVFAIGIIIPILLLIHAVGDVQVILLVFCLAEIGFATLAVLIVPKVLQYQAAQQDAVSEASKSSSGNDSYSFIPLDNLSSPAQLAAYVTALQRHMDEARKAMHKQKIAAVGATTTLTPTGSKLGGGGSSRHGAQKLSISVGSTVAAALVETAQPSSSPSIRISSSRVQPQASPDGGQSWRLSESRKVAWTPPRSSHSEPADATPHGEQQQQQQHAALDTTGRIVDSPASASDRARSSLSRQTPIQLHVENRSGRAPAAGAASIIAATAASDSGVCVEE